MIRARIRAIDDAYPSMHERLARLWSSLSARTTGQPRAEREAALTLYEARFAAGSVGVDVAVRLLDSLNRKAKIIKRFSWAEKCCTPAHIELGRTDDILPAFLNSRGAWATAMTSAGKFDEVINIKLVMGWAIRSIESLRGKWLDYPIVEAKDLWDAGFYKGWKSSWIFEHRPETKLRMRALIFLERLDEVLAIPPDGRNQEYWHYLAAALAGREDEIVSGKPINDERFLAQVLYWRLMRARARGDRVAAQRALERIQLGDSDYGDKSIGFTRLLLIVSSRSSMATRILLLQGLRISRPTAQRSGKSAYGTLVNAAPVDFPTSSLWSSQSCSIVPGHSLCVVPCEQNGKAGWLMLWLPISPYRRIGAWC